MSIRPDKIVLLTTLPSYINIGNPTGNIAISGGVTAGATANFSVTINTSTTNTRSDIYGSNAATGYKQILSGTSFVSDNAVTIGGIYESVSSEAVSIAVSQSSSNVIVTLSIFNGTGVDITLTTQTIAIEVVEYAIPY